VRVTVLGSGDAFGSGGRGHSAYLVEAGGTTFLLEAGPTILQALKSAGHDPGAIDFVVLSHLHGDHFGGVPFLFLEYRYERPRSRPLTIYGPRDTERRVEALYQALYEQVSREPPPYPLTYQTIMPGSPLAIGGVEIAPFHVPHATELECFGFRIEVAGRTIVYSGDSAWTDAFLAQVQGADLFVCECSTYETRLDIHLSYPEIAARGRDLGCKRLVLSHLGREPLAHLSELSLECARDGLVIDL
jgi:ribonuclease BN (tRNA processing enzyme)